LFVGQRPIDLVVVSRTQIDHDVFVAIEKHGRASIPSCKFVEIIAILLREKELAS